jgi:hypothetical protein
MRARPRRMVVHQLARCADPISNELGRTDGVSTTTDQNGCLNDPEDKASLSEGIHY